MQATSEPTIDRKVTGFVRLAIPASVDGEGSAGAGVGGVWLVVYERRIPRALSSIQVR